MLFLPPRNTAQPLRPLRLNWFYLSRSSNSRKVQHPFKRSGRGGCAVFRRGSCLFSLTMVMLLNAVYGV
jgi:hypothetical protein